MKIVLYVFSWLVAFERILASEVSFLDALRVVSGHVLDADWKEFLKQEDIYPSENNLLDRLFLRASVDKDLGLPALLSVCEKVVQPTLSQARQEQAFIHTVGEQLLEPAKAQTIVDWVLTAYYSELPQIVESLDNPELACHAIHVVAADKEIDLSLEVLETEKEKFSPRVVSSPALSSPILAPISRKTVCENVSHVPYMDWTYFLSLPSLFEFPICCFECDSSSLRDGFFLARARYTGAEVQLKGRNSTIQSPAVSLLTGITLSDSWTFCGMLDFSPSFGSWKNVKDHTNRWSMASSIVFTSPKAYAQLMALGSYNTSEVSHESQDDFRFNHWNLAFRLDGAFYTSFSKNSILYVIEPYVCVDYFAVFQSDIPRPNVVAIHQAQFFDIKSLIKCYTEFFPSKYFCVVPQIGIGCSYNRTLSQLASSCFSESVAVYPNWWGGIINGSISLFSKGNFVTKVLAEAILSPSTQIYDANVAFGWSW